ncbi:putative serine esterase-domain-containing protein [Scleroderma yunnanense]
MANVHLLVLIHGMWGNPLHLARMHEIIQQVKGGVENAHSEQTELAVLVAQTNRDECTYDGIDWGGERVSLEIMNEVSKYEMQGKKVNRFSVMGYSLGGLVARYVVGILHQNMFFETITPVNFNTIATPHIGIPQFPTAMSAISSYFGRNFLSRTGEQFFCADKWSLRGRPLVEVLGDPEYIFYHALILFKTIGIYANTINDRTVPYVTAAIELTDPFAEYRTNGVEIEFHEQYEHIIKSYTLPAASPHPPDRPSLFTSISTGLPPIPPVFRFEFPLNLILFPLLPVLIPAFLSLILVRWSISSQKSRIRLRSLETNSPARERLIHVIAELEREIETRALDAYEHPGGPLSVNSPSVDSEPPKLVLEPKTVQNERGYYFSSRPFLTPGQLRCIENLNKIPQLRKTLVFFVDVANSHAMIIARDPKFEHHRKGEAVLRHWADHFEL